MSDTRRIYHPTLGSVLDVSKSEANTWKEAGWRFTRPEHITDEVLAEFPPEENEPVVVTATDATPKTK